MKTILAAALMVAALSSPSFARGGHGHGGGHGGGHSQPEPQAAPPGPSASPGSPNAADPGTNVYAYDPAALTYCGAWTGDYFCKAGLVVDNQRIGRK